MMKGEQTTFLKTSDWVAIDYGPFLIYDRYGASVLVFTWYIGHLCPRCDPCHEELFEYSQSIVLRICIPYSNLRPRYAHLRCPSGHSMTVKLQSMTYFGAHYGTFNDYFHGGQFMVWLLWPCVFPVVDHILTVIDHIFTIICLQSVCPSDESVFESPTTLFRIPIVTNTNGVFGN